MSVVRIFGPLFLFAVVVRPVSVDVAPSVETDAQRPSIGELLARYDRGEYRKALDQTGRIKDPRSFARDWEETAEDWSVAAADEAEVASRRLTAASFALEVAHALQPRKPQAEQPIRRTSSQILIKLWRACLRIFGDAMSCTTDPQA
jgi:hypothetical protein